MLEFNRVRLRVAEIRSYSLVIRRLNVKDESFRADWHRFKAEDPVIVEQRSCCCS